MLLRYFRFIILLLLILLTGILISAFSAVLIKFIAQWFDGAFETWLADHGWDRVMRRCLLIYGVIFLAFFVRRLGWRCWKDFGFVTDDPFSQRPPWLLTFLGIVLGVVTLGAIMVLAVVLHLRSFTSDAASLFSSLSLFNVFLAGIGVAVVEETICRGIIFRMIAKFTPVWIAVLIGSLLYSLAHFLSPAPASFQADSFFASIAHVFVSTLNIAPNISGSVLQFVNLTLLGIVLCAFVIKTKTIWFSIGAHAAWVWVIKSNSFCTEPYVGTGFISVFMGSRGDFMDSLMPTVLFIGILWWVNRYSEEKTILLRRNKVIWHVVPYAKNSLEKLFDSHLKNDFTAGRRILESYNSCRVIAEDGWVFKEFSPKKGWRAIRFYLLPLRAHRAFVLAFKLIAIGIQTPAAVAWASKRKIGLLRAGYLVTREITDAQPLTNWLKSSSAQERMQSGVMASYGCLMAQFHTNGYSNRDLKHENVLSSVNQPLNLYVVDLDGVRRKWIITRRRAKRDLRRIGYSLAALGCSLETDLCAFFDAYNALVPARLRRNSFPS